MGPLKPGHWRTANRRRVALIKQQFACGLTDTEEDELRSLQELADRQLEGPDAQMLDDVAKMEANVRRVTDHGQLTTDN